MTRVSPSQLARGDAGELRKGRLGRVVERDDADVVHHLVQDRDVTGRLEDHHVVVVGARAHRRTGVETHDAAVGQAAVLVGVVPVLLLVGAPLRRGLDGRLGPWRQPAVGRIDDERCPLVGSELDAALVPELVVRQHPAFGSRAVARRPLLGIEEVAVQTRPFGRLESRRLLRRELLDALELPGPLERRQGAEREDPGDVRLSVRRPHRHRTAGGRLRDRRRRRERDRDGQHDERRKVFPEHLPASPAPASRGALSTDHSRRGRLETQVPQSPSDTRSGCSAIQVVTAVTISSMSSSRRASSS